MNVQRHRPFVFIVLSYGFGIFVQSWFKVPFVYVCLAALLSVLLCVVLRHRMRIFTILLWLTLSCAGAVHVESQREPHASHILHEAKFYRRKNIRLKGVIVSDVQHKMFFQGPKTVFTLKVQSVNLPWGWRARRGKVLVNVFQDLHVSYGDVVILEGKMHRPYNFSDSAKSSYPEYLKRRQIYLMLSVKSKSPVEVIGVSPRHTLRSEVFKLRNRLKGVLQDYLTDNEAGIMQAILLGERSRIPKHIRELFVNTGTVHILAISGLHVGVVSALVLLVLKMLPIRRRVPLLLTVLFLAAYVFLTGGRPSVVRATVMSIVFLMSFFCERQGDMLNTLGLSAFLILLMNPLNVFDVGFQLSFVCVLSIIFFNPKVEGVLLSNVKPKHGIVRFFVQSFSISLSVWLGVAGLVAYYFDIVTPITILANLVVVPLLAPIVALGIGLLLTGMVLPSAAFMFANCIKLLLNVMAGSIFLFARVPGAYVQFKHVPLWGIIVYYALIFLVLISLGLIPRGLPRFRNI